MAASSEAKKVPRGRSERLVECRRRLRQDWEFERYVVTEHAARLSRSPWNFAVAIW
jgi:hypothetical protein